MRRATVLLGLALLAAGCGDGGKPAAEATTTAPAQAGKPAADEVKGCLAAYLDQCGWKDVEVGGITAQDALPPGVSAPAGEAWAYTFSAGFTNVLGERQSVANWVAVVGRADGQPCVRSCYDEARRLVGGHTGTEQQGAVADLTPIPPAEDLAPIVAPNP